MRKKTLTTQLQNNTKNVFRMIRGGTEPEYNGAGALESSPEYDAFIPDTLAPGGEYRRTFESCHYGISALHVIPLINRQAC